MENVDWVPTLHLGYQIKRECDQQEENVNLITSLEIGYRIKQECDQQVENVNWVTPLNLGYRIENVGDQQKENVEWIPTLHLEYQIKAECNQEEQNVICVPTLDDYQIKKECDQQEEPHEQLHLKEQFEVVSNQVDSKEFIKFSVGTQTDDRFTGVSPEIITLYQERIAFLEEMLKTKKFTLDK